MATACLFHWMIANCCCFLHIVYDGVKHGLGYYQKLLPERVNVAFLKYKRVSTGVISLGGNWFSASKGYALTDSDILSHLLVKGGSVTTCSSVDLKGTFAASGSWSFSTLLFPKKKNFSKNSMK